MSDWPESTREHYRREIMRGFNVDYKTACRFLDGKIHYCIRGKHFLPATTEYFPMGKRPHSGLTSICYGCRKRVSRPVPIEYRREYYRRTEVRARMYTYEANKRARKKSLPHSFTIEQRAFAIEYFHNSCAVCGRQLFDLFGEHKLAFDHWIPLSSPECPGSTVTNLIPLCHGVNGCNNSKHARDPHEWLTARYGKRRAQAIIDRIEAYFAIVGQSS